MVDGLSFLLKRIKKAKRTNLYALIDFNLLLNFLHRVVAASGFFSTGSWRRFLTTVHFVVFGFWTGLWGFNTRRFVFGFLWSF